MTPTRASDVLEMFVDVITVPPEVPIMLTGDKDSSKLQSNQQNKVYQCYKHSC